MDHKWLNFADVRGRRNILEGKVPGHSHLNLSEYECNGQFEGDV